MSTQDALLVIQLPSLDMKKKKRTVLLVLHQSENRRRQKRKAARQQSQDFVMDYRASNVDVAAKKLQIHIHGCSHTFIPAAQKIYTIDGFSRLVLPVPKISVTNLVPEQM